MGLELNLWVGGSGLKVKFSLCCLHFLEFKYAHVLSFPGLESTNYTIVKQRSDKMKGNKLNKSFCSITRLIRNSRMPNKTKSVLENDRPLAPLGFELGLRVAIYRRPIIQIINPITLEPYWQKKVINNA